MELLEHHLFLEKSNIPGAGIGLFTNIFIPKGTRIVEYKGPVYTWKQIQDLDEACYDYLFYMNSRHVINGWQCKDGMAHYANDAKGMVRVPGLKNNSEYVVDGKECFIEAIRDIPPGSEILVGYGPEYWKVARENAKLERDRVSSVEK